MARNRFFCIDGHTCGNPVRLVAGGAPQLDGATMLERRAHFLADYDWIRTGLMFEPRGHDMMSGAILYPPTREDCDTAFLFIETSGCLPMCGHGTIGTVTMAIENGLVSPREPGVLAIDTPAGRIVAQYSLEGRKVTQVKLTNVPAFLHSHRLEDLVRGTGRDPCRRCLWRQFLRHSRRSGQLCRHGQVLRGRFGADESGAPGSAQCREPVCSSRKTSDQGSEPHPLGPVRRPGPKPMPAMQFSTATRPSTDRPAAPARRQGWRNGPPGDA
jgi:hypothetical protein